MDRNLVILIAESFQKEIEHYQLDKIGFVQNTRAEIDYLVNHIIVASEARKVVDIESYRQWRLSVFGAYYQNKDFAAFVQSHLHQTPFSKMVYNLMNNLLIQRFSHSPRTDTDHFLAPPGKTLSWLLCDEEFVKIYPRYFSNNIRIENTEQLTSYCQNILTSIFPLSTTDVLTYLSNDYKIHWENLCIRIKNLTETVTKAVIKPYRYDATHDIWTETCFELRKAIQNGNLPLTADAPGVYAYTKGIIRNKIRAFFRTQKKEAWLLLVDLEQDPSFQISEQFSYEINDDPIMNEFVDLSNIDLEDDEVLRNVMSYLLHDQEHPIHQKLTEGLEDKIDILVLHYVKHLSYEEIALGKISNPTTEELIRETARLRKEASRGKIKIKERIRRFFSSNK